MGGNPANMAGMAGMGGLDWSHMAVRPLPLPCCPCAAAFALRVLPVRSACCPCVCVHDTE